MLLGTAPVNTDQSFLHPTFKIPLSHSALQCVTLNSLLFLSSSLKKVVCFFRLVQIYQPSGISVSGHLENVSKKGDLVDLSLLCIPCAGCEWGLALRLCIHYYNLAIIHSLWLYASRLVTHSLFS